MRLGTRTPIVLLSFAALFPAPACGVLVPDARTPADRARETEPKCGGFADTSAAQIASGDAIDAVEPGYSYVKSGPENRAARLRGARIRLRPLPNATKESIARALACHQAGVTLGRLPAVADDPYFAKDRWLDIDVSSEGDGFAVLVQTDDLETARGVLERAKRFAATRAR
jgi:hypothetical protein